MSDIQYNLQFEKLCSVLQLGEIAGVPEALSGGLLHRMYAIKTTQGKYAIKALNPQIMARPKAMQDIINGEQIAGIAANNISTLTAKKINGIIVHEIDNQYYLVFDWVDGKSLKPNEIGITHCVKIASILADIHMTDFSQLGMVDDYSSDEPLTDWNYYLQKGQKSNSVWADLLLENIEDLYSWSAELNIAAKSLASDTIISHGDLDPKNVMWSKDNPIIIDWEAAGFVNPMFDLINTAIDWSKNETGDIDKDKFMAFIDGYKKKHGTLKADWRTVLKKGFSLLGWLEYSLKRSLWIECTDDAEQQMGTEHVTGTIKAIRRYADMISELEKWLNNPT